MQSLGVINSFMEGCEEALLFLRSQKSFFECLSLILKSNLENYQVLNICLRTIRNGIKKEVIKIEDFMQV